MLWKILSAILSLLLLVGTLLLTCSCGDGASTDTDGDDFYSSSELSDTNSTEGSDTFGAVDSDANSDTDVVTENTERRLLVAMDGSSVLKVIVSETCSDDLKKETQSLVQKLYDLTGSEITVLYEKNADVSAISSENEIVIGSCHRAESLRLLDEMKYGDYRITTAGNSLLVACYNDEAALSAVSRLRSRLSKDNIINEDGSVYLVWTRDITYTKKSYVYSDMTVAGTPINEYNIVYGDDANGKYSLESAKKIQTIIAEKTGYILDILSDKHLDHKQDTEILVGNTNRIEKFSTSDPMELTVKLSGPYLVVAGSSPFAVFSAAEELERIISDKKGRLDELDTGIMSAQTDFEECDSDYRIMQYNILVEYEGWGSGGILVPDLEYRKDLTASIINGHDPDVIVLCEVFEGWADLLPSMLPDYTMVCAVRSDGKSNRTPLVYKTERFDLVASGYKDVYVKYDTTNNRVVTWAVLEDKITKERLIVFGTHWEVTSEDNRVKQAEMTAALIDEITTKYNGVVILAGDFNTKAGNASYSRLKKLTGFTDAVANTAGVGVDHMFFDSKQVTVNKALIDSGHNTQYASDHEPVVCDIDLK